MNNIEIFNDTQNIVKRSSQLKLLTNKSIAETKIYNENFISQKTQVFTYPSVKVKEALTLQAVSEIYGKYKNIAILNFANPIEPGGGVLRGANAQEEYLCRASNLYNCLTSEKATEFYEYHQRNRNNIFSDKIIYCPNVQFFKKDVLKNKYTFEEYPDFIQQYTDDFITADVITCAAPYWHNEIDISENELLEIMKKRVTNIFEAAIENKIEALILGAFGCGAFRNPPHIVAESFRQVLLSERYINSFKEVVFAIKRTGSFCPNIEAFEVKFLEFPFNDYAFSPERNKRRFFE